MNSLSYFLLDLTVPWSRHLMLKVELLKEKQPVGYPIPAICRLVYFKDGFLTRVSCRTDLDTIAAQHPQMMDVLRRRFARFLEVV